MASAPDALERAAGTSRPARDIKRAWAPLRGGGKGLCFVQKDRCKVFQGRSRRRLFVVTCSFVRFCQPDA
jgi:hypothetical protein